MLDSLVKLLCENRTSSERKAIEKLVTRVVTSLESARGRAYSQSTRIKKQNEIEHSVEVLIQQKTLAGVTALNPRPKTPLRPSKVIGKFEADKTRYNMLLYRMRIDESEPRPKVPEELKRYKRQCDKVCASARKALSQKSLYWAANPIIQEIEEALRSSFVRTVRKPVTRKLPFASKQVESPGYLVGDSRSGREDSRLLSAEEVQIRVSLPLDFLDEIHQQGNSRAQIAREVESGKHRGLVSQMVGLLLRLGYDVYPGDVGIKGVYAMADLLALDNSEPLFVECLTDSAVKRGSHIKKLALASKVPFCFVANLPKEFANALPLNVFSVPYPGSPRTCTDQWVPKFWLKPTHKHCQLTGRVSRTRSRIRVLVTGEGLRLPEDVSGFFGMALVSIFTNSKESGWRISGSCRIPPIPFDRHGKSGSIIRGCNRSREIVAKLGKVPVEVSCSDEVALEYLTTALLKIGLPLEQI